MKLQCTFVLISLRLTRCCECVQLHHSHAFWSDSDLGYVGLLFHLCEYPQRTEKFPHHLGHCQKVFTCSLLPLLPLYLFPSLPLSLSPSLSPFEGFVHGEMLICVSGGGRAQMCPLVRRGRDGEMLCGCGMGEETVRWACLTQGAGQYYLKGS